MPRALLIGGSGPLGTAIARRLLTAGWDVDVVGRGQHALAADVARDGGRLVLADRTDPLALRHAGRAGADLLVDCVCFTAEQARGLLPLARHCTSTVLISSRAVYVDAAGNHTNSPISPRFDGPITEQQPTLAPGGGDPDTAAGYGRNKVAAERVLLDSGLPVTVLRPSKIHGPGAVKPNEWVFLKRVLDRRPFLVLPHRGQAVDHTTAAVNLAALVEVAAANPGARIVNSADPDAPSTLQISRVVASHLRHRWQEVLVDGPLPRLPWRSRHPVVLDTAAARALGYTPVGDYAATVGPALDWLLATAAATGELPAGYDRGYFTDMLDYALEDAQLPPRAGAGAD